MACAGCMADRDAVPRALLAVLLGVFNKMPGMTEAAKTTVRTSIKRRFYACVSGSLHQLGTGGSDGACWSTQNGTCRASVYRRPLG